MRRTQINHVHDASALSPRTLCVLLAGSLAFASTALGSLPPDKLPYQRATGVENANGKRVIQGWSGRDNLRPQMTERYTPDNTAFDGAELWHIGVKARQLDAIAVEAFSAAGMTEVRLLAKREGNPIAVAAAAPRPDMKMTAVMVSGLLKTKPAKGIGFVFHGMDDEDAGVSAFMAPSNVFVALGGHIIPEVHWYLGTTEQGHDLIAEGSLSPQEAVDEASMFFSLWVASYVIPLKGIQQQSLQLMQSWSNAMNVCAGDPQCTVTPMNDGSGGWEPVVE